MMKKTIQVGFLFLGLSSMSLACSIPKKSTQVQHIIQEDAKAILLNIQEKIDTAFGKCFQERTTTPLDSLAKQLSSLDQESSVVRYWKNYINYYKSIYFIKMRDRDKSKEIIKQCYEELEDISDKTSEDYALLAIVQGFYSQFVSGFSAWKISSKIVDNAENALKLDPLNIRALYALASNDFYTPEKYGGGKKVESYLIKALQVPTSKDRNPYLPSWGREYAYDLLIKYYLRSDEWKEAETYLEKAEKEFPNAYFIRGYKEQLKGKR